MDKKVIKILPEFRLEGDLQYCLYKFLNFQLTFFSADITPEIPKLCRVTRVKVFFLVLVYVFNVS